MTAVPKSDYIAAMFDDSTVLLHIHDETVRTSETPSVAALASEFGAAVTDIRAPLRRMHKAHTPVLRPGGEVLMANPFSAVPTPFVSEVGDRRWFGNCIWDAFGILATLHVIGRVLTPCGCRGDALSSAVKVGSTGQRLLRGRFSSP